MTRSHFVSSIAHASTASASSAAGSSAPGSSTPGSSGGDGEVEDDAAQFGPARRGTYRSRLRRRATQTACALLVLACGLGAPSLAGQTAAADGTPGLTASKALPGGQTQEIDRNALVRKAGRLWKKSGWVDAHRSWKESSGKASGAPAAIPAPRPLSRSEWDRVLHGWTVSQGVDFQMNGHKYVGGAAYQVIAAEPEAILDALSDASQMPQALPLTHDATLLSSTPREHSLLPGPAQGGAQRGSESYGTLARRNATVELVQGNALFKARYALKLNRSDASTLQFALDPTRDHDIRDARGTFTAHRLTSTHTLVSVFVGVDLGGGLAKTLLRRPVQKAALSAPAHIRAYVEPIAHRERVAEAAAAERDRSRSANTVADRR